MLDSQLYDDLTFHSLLRSLAFYQTLFFRKSIFRHLIFGFSEVSKATDWSIFIFNYVWTLLSSYYVFLLLKIHDLLVKISVFEKNLYTVRKNTRYSKRKLEWKNVAKLSNIMLKGYQITKKIKSFPTEFFKNQPEVPKSRMAVKGLNWIRLKNRHHFEKPTF